MINGVLIVQGYRETRYHEEKESKIDRGEWKSFVDCLEAENGSAREGAWRFLRGGGGWRDDVGLR